MGKTRFAQALFDARIGERALDPALAVYGDVAADPQIAPRALMEQRIALNPRAVLIVDNCPSQLHRDLVSLVSAANSQVSLLTIEFDVGEDDFDTTFDCRIEPASQAVIEQLLARRFPTLSQVDRRRIGDLSEGNARIALALARTAGKSDALGTLSDTRLLERLFLQRQVVDPQLQRAGETAALVYSFDVETYQGADAELPILASLARMDVAEFYAAIAQLGRVRELWAVPSCRGDLVNALRRVRGDKFWRDGWFALCTTLFFEREEATSEEHAPLVELEREFKPESIEDRLDAFALGNPWDWYDPHEPDLHASYASRFKKAEAVGREIAHDLSLLRTFSERMVLSDSPATAQFGAGLGEAVPDLEGTWNVLRRIFEHATPERRNVRLLQGFIASGKTKPGRC